MKKTIDTAKNGMKVLEGMTAAADIAKAARLIREVADLLFVESVVMETVEGGMHCTDCRHPRIEAYFELIGALSAACEEFGGALPDGFLLQCLRNAAKSEMKGATPMIWRDVDPDSGCIEKPHFH